MSVSSALFRWCTGVHMYIYIDIIYIYNRYMYRYIYTCIYNTHTCMYYIHKCMNILYLMLCIIYDTHQSIYYIHYILELTLVHHNINCSCACGLHFNQLIEANAQGSARQRKAPQGSMLQSLDNLAVLFCQLVLTTVM